ncbi:transposase family protein [Streptomyces tailanensis]|uniref:transposase family protein n=1 Tax=Streptomyces tailanensis TaxID=2569858 RepID=UPI001FE558D1|nr:transposase family protein [Streptomyces tailanensis]
MTVLVMQADASFWDSLVFDGIDDVDAEAVSAAVGTVDVMARGRGAGAACPDCGRFSARVHGSCQRRLKDLPLGGQSVVIRLTVRRFICGPCTAAQGQHRADHPALQDQPVTSPVDLTLVDEHPARA